MCSRADVTVSSHYRESVSRPEEMVNERLGHGAQENPTRNKLTANKISSSIEWPPGRSQIWRAQELVPRISDPESLVLARSHRSSWA